MAIYLYSPFAGGWELTIGIINGRNKRFALNRDE